MQKTITKSLGDGTLIEIPDPDYYLENGFRAKIREKVTNFTPKKKKRRK